MNYKRIHDNLIAYARKVNPRDRLRLRCPTDSRLEVKSIYTEVHHITPRSLGGVDEPYNLVEVLPEEHLFLHRLRYHIYKQREDILAVRFMLNGFTGKNFSGIALKIPKAIRLGYAWIRSKSAILRSEKAWQSENGRLRIAQARTGKMPAVNSLTGEKVGSVPINHPNVISGLWVHHSKGKKITEERRRKMRERSRGQGNANFSGLSDDYLLKKALELFREFGYILPWIEIVGLSSVRGFPWIKSLKSRFDRRGLRGFYEEVQRATGTTYDPHRTKRRNKITKL